MKILRTITSLFAVAALLVGGASFAFAAPLTGNCDKPVRISSWYGCEPIISTQGTVRTNEYSAVVSAFYTSNGADYNSTDRPVISIQYGTNEGELYQSTGTLSQSPGSNTVSFLLENLTEGSKVYYRARLTWVGGEKFGEIKPVVWKSSSSQYTGSSTSNSLDGTNTSGNNITTTANSNNSNTVVASTSLYGTSTNNNSNTSSPGLFGWLTGSKSKTTTTTSRFKNVDEKSGLKLAIDDGETQVHQGDTVTLKVRYENNSAKSYSNGTIDIYLPDQYTIETTNKGIHDKVDNMVSISLRDFPAGGFGTAIIIAKATGGSKDLDQAVSQAGLKAGDISLKVTDIDEYVAGSGKSSSGLGASVSGARFVPGSLIGWIILLVLLAGIIIIGRRYFVKKDY